MDRGRGAHVLVRMFHNDADILENHGHEAKVDEVDISHQPVLLAVVDEELDVGRDP